MSAAMHLRNVKNKANRRAHVERARQKSAERSQILARAGQIAAMDRLGRLSEATVELFQREEHK